MFKKVNFCFTDLIIFFLIFQKKKSGQKYVFLFFTMSQSFSKNDFKAFLRVNTLVYCLLYRRSMRRLTDNGFREN